MVWVLTVQTGSLLGFSCCATDSDKDPYMILFTDRPIHDSVTQKGQVGEMLGGGKKGAQPFVHQMPA